MNLNYLDCFDDLIGYRGECSPVTPSSGVYLNDFTGIIIDELNAGVDSEVQDAFTLLDRKINIAKAALASDIYSSLALNQRGTTLLNNQIVGYYQDNLQSVAAHSSYKGVQLWNHTASNYLEITIPEIALQTQHTGDIDVKIFDLITSKLIKTITVPAVANEIVRVDTNFSYLSKKQWTNLFIGYDATNIASYQTFASGTGCSSCNRNYRNNYFVMMGAGIGLATNKINSNVQSYDNTAGLSITYSVNCAVEPFICSIRNLLPMPLALKTLSEVMREMGNSNRFNSIITLNRKDNKELMEYYDTEYARYLKNITMNMALEDPVCWPCLPKVKIRTIVP